MSKRHAGWLIHRLKELFVKEIPHSTDATARLNSYKAIPGLEKKLIKLFIDVNQYHAGTNFKESLNNNPIFSKFDNFFIKPLIPEWANVKLTEKLYLIKHLAARSYKAIRMAKRRPVHGQRRWSNSKMARRCNIFLWRTIKEYELDLFNYKQRRRFTWSYAWEMRQKAKLKKKTTKKKWTKFRKFGERRLSIKKKKKTPWD